MRKTIIKFLLACFAGWLLAQIVNHFIHKGIELGKAKDALVISETNVSISREAKWQGEAATTRADLEKSVIRGRSSASKEKLRENFTSYDDKPLPDDVVVELCRAYNYEDCVRLSTEQPITGNKG